MAYQDSALLSSTFNVVMTARPGVDLSELMGMMRAELERASIAIESRELERAVNRFETTFVGSLQTVGDFGGRADRLNHYAFHAGDPGFAARDLARYQSLTPEAVSAAARRFLIESPSVVLSVVPRGAGATALHSL